jgi:hypothetical protein
VEFAASLKVTRARYNMTSARKILAICRVQYARNAKGEEAGGTLLIINFPSQKINGGTSQNRDHFARIERD